MKDRRGAGFPFSIGCMSQSAVAVADPLEKKQPQQAEPPSPSSTTANNTQEKGRRSITEKGRRSISDKGAGEESDGVSDEKAKAAAAAGIVAAGVQRLVKGIKSLSQMFAAYDGEEEDEEEREIVIGYPTDVQHVGHIGWDGLNKVGGLGMASAFSLPSSLSLRHLEIAMDAGAGTATTCTN